MTSRERVETPAARSGPYGVLVGVVQPAVFGTTQYLGWRGVVNDPPRPASLCDIIHRKSALRSFTKRGTLRSRERQTPWAPCRRHENGR